MCKTSVDPSGLLLYKSSKIVVYADDINILALSKETAKEDLAKLYEAPKEVDIEIDEEILKLEHNPEERLIRQNVTLNDHNLG